MKLFIKLMIFLVILTVAGPYLLLGPSGMSKLLAFKDLALSRMSFSMPSLSLPSMKGDDEVSVTDAVAEQWIQWSDNVPALGPDQLTREQLAQLDIQPQDNIFYRWQDENGVWQFSQQPNRNTLNLVVRTDPTANLLQGLSEEQIDVAFGRVRTAATTNSIVENNPLAKNQDLDSSLPVPVTIPVTEIPKLIEQAKDVQNIMNERMKQMDAGL
ncbi:MAG: hypothetical protein D6160_19905 [Ketobacter sp.]|nr:MAG: hypothetical protein D6160_19905 [Ketobacter sp.]